MLLPSLRAQLAAAASHAAKQAACPSSASAVQHGSSDEPVGHRLLLHTRRAHDDVHHECMGVHGWGFDRACRRTCVDVSDAVIDGGAETCRMRTFRLLRARLAIGERRK